MKVEKEIQKVEHNFKILKGYAETQLLLTQFGTAIFIITLILLRRYKKKGRNKKLLLLFAFINISIILYKLYLAFEMAL